MKKIKLGLFITTILGTLGGLAFSIYYISTTKRINSEIKIKGVFDVDFLKQFKNYFLKKNANIVKGNLYFNYEIPSKNKSLKYNENKLFNIGSQSESLLAFTTIRLIQDTSSQSDPIKKITLNDKLNKWYKTNSSNNKNKEIADILNSNKLKPFNPFNKKYNFLTDVSILNLLTYSSDLPNFNNLKKENPVTNEIKENYQKQIIEWNSDGTFKNFVALNNSSFELLDFMRLASSNLVEKTKNYVDLKNYYKDELYHELSHGFGPWNKTDNFWINKNYSPLNYIILGNIIEKVYKEFKGITKTFDEIIKEYILDPLEMNNTYYNIKKIDKFKDKIYKEIPTSFLNASNGFVSSLEDLTKFYKAIYKKESILLPSKTFNGSNDPYKGWYKLTEMPSKYSINNNFLNRNWRGPGATRLYYWLNYNVELSDYIETLYFNRGISPDFRSWAFFSKEKDFFLTVASDIPYSYYSTNKNSSNNSSKSPTPTTDLIDETFGFEIFNLLTKIIK